MLVDAVVNRTELAMPPSITMEMAKGFTLYMVRAVMSGRGDELIDLARTNCGANTDEVMAGPVRFGHRDCEPLAVSRIEPGDND